MIAISIIAVLEYFLISVAAKQILFPTTYSGPCKIESGGRGRCRELNKCFPLIKKIEQGYNPTHCGFKNSMPIICCPIDTDFLSGNNSITETRLGEVSAPKITFGCGRRVSSEKRTFRAFVSGGTTSFKHSWPWMVLLGRKSESGETFFCSAVILNENYVITAAHCILEAAPYFVRVGEHDYSPSEVGTNHQEIIEDIPVRDILTHPQYNLNQGYHDIALLRLTTPIRFRKEASPICLPWGRLAKENLVNEQVTIAGWGRLGFGELPSTILQEVNVTVFDFSVCEKSYSTLRDHNEIYPQGFKNRIICAGHTDGVKDACDGDSGGPLMHYKSETGTFSLAGIISKGYGCGIKEFPGLYAPLRDYQTMKWIKDVAF